MIPAVSEYDEDNLVKTYMRRYGIDNVRGGSYTTLALSDAEFEILEREIGTCTDTCFRCGRTSHFANACHAVRHADGTRIEAVDSCQRCGHDGHTIDRCYARRDIDGQVLEACVCFIYERAGHTADICYARRDVHGNAIN